MGKVFFQYIIWCHIEVLDVFFIKNRFHPKKDKNVSLGCNPSTGHWHIFPQKNTCFTVNLNQTFNLQVSYNSSSHRLIS